MAYLNETLRDGVVVAMRGDKMMAISGFPPVAADSAAVLILGSMPGQASLNVAQYYAHPRNAFWPIIGELFNAPQSLSYEERLVLVQENKIALWDVMKNCKREGSLDSAIEPSSVVANNFVDFFAAHPSIRHLFFNGAQAEAAFKRHVVPVLYPKGDRRKCLWCRPPEFDIVLEMQRLPSTSPAHAALSFEQKLAQWQCVRDVIAP